MSVFLQPKFSSAWYGFSPCCGRRCLIWPLHTDGQQGSNTSFSLQTGRSCSSQRCRYPAHFVCCWWSRRTGGQVRWHEADKKNAKKCPSLTQTDVMNGMLGETTHFKWQPCRLAVNAKAQWSIAHKAGEGLFSQPILLDYRI